MAQIACRWPGGMTLAVMRPAGLPLTFRVDGPSGQPRLLTPEEEKSPPSRYAATQIQKTVADTARRMAKTAGDQHGPMDYGVTSVPDDVWAAWLAQNSGFDVVTQRMVFQL